MHTYSHISTQCECRVWRSNSPCPSPSTFQEAGKQSKGQETRLEDTTHQPLDLTSMSIHNWILWALHQKQGMKTRGPHSGSLGVLQDPLWHWFSTLESSWTLWEKLSWRMINSQQTKWLSFSFKSLYSSESLSKSDIKINSVVLHKAVWVFWSGEIYVKS